MTHFKYDGAEKPSAHATAIRGEEQRLPIPRRISYLSLSECHTCFQEVGKSKSRAP
jgi:hypothetical protein